MTKLGAGSRVAGAAACVLACGLAGCRSAAEWDCRCVSAVALTAGAGNDTEAAWSPDGRRVAFQTDRKGDPDIAVLDVSDGSVTVIDGGPDYACYPAWTPGGGLVYASGRQAGTAAQTAAAPEASGTGLRLWTAGQTRVLTQGGWRDYTPSVSPDGAAVTYASTRGNTGNSAALWRLPLAAGGEAACVLPLDGGSVGATQPSLSPDGRLLLWTQQRGVWDNWRLYAAPAGRLAEGLALTPASMSAYAPRWSPDGRLIAFTGFRAGDPGWGLYIQDVRSGALARLETGPGNARSPCWSPDGRELVFENNRTGVYKLYRARLRITPAPLPPDVPAAAAQTDRVEARLVDVDGGFALAAADGARTAAVRQEGPALRFEAPRGLDFGGEPFFVRVTLTVRRFTGDTMIAAVGHYDEHPLGWQVFVRANGTLCFSARQADGTYVGVESDLPAPRGRPFDVLGIRDADGGIRLFIDGVQQRQQAAGALLRYGPARRVCLGQQWNGGLRLEGAVSAFACGRGYPDGVPRLMTRDRLFGEGTP